MNESLTPDKSKITTEMLLRLEDAGGILSNGDLPYGINPVDGLDVWIKAFPLVDTDLIMSWYSMFKAKFFLKYAMANARLKSSF